jgi:hypothetical protein
MEQGMPANPRLKLNPIDASRIPDLGRTEKARLIARTEEIMGPLSEAARRRAWGEVVKRELRDAIVIAVFLYILARFLLSLEAGTLVAVLIGAFTGSIGVSLVGIRAKVSKRAGTYEVKPTEEEAIELAGMFDKRRQLIHREPGPIDAEVLEMAVTLFNADLAQTDVAASDEATLKGLARRRDELAARIDRLRVGVFSI